MIISICKTCDGKGEREVKEDYSNDYTTIKCSRCKGTGRLLYNTYTAEFPFGTHSSIINKFDNQIIEWIHLIPKFLYIDNKPEKKDGKCADCISMLNQTGICYCDTIDN